jgi:cytochrome c oxidase assembly protein subunit 23
MNLAFAELDRHHESMPSSTDPLPFPKPPETYDYPDPTTAAEKNAFRTKGASKYYDPCGPASQASMKCLDRNNYDKSKCQEAFDAYKECKRLWVCQSILLI